MQENSVYEKNKKSRSQVKTKRPKSAFGPLFQSSESLNSSISESLNSSLTSSKTNCSNTSIHSANINLLKYLTKADSKTSLNELFSLANRLDSNSYTICNKKYFKNLNTSSNSSINSFLKNSNNNQSSNKKFFYRNRYLHKVTIPNFF